MVVRSVFFLVYKVVLFCFFIVVESVCFVWFLVCCFIYGVLGVVVVKLMDFVSSNNIVEVINIEFDENSFILIEL